MLRNLGELEGDGRSLAFCHHFTKPGETQKGRKSADRMAGSGALYGALDAGLFITQNDGARSFQVEVETRDIRSPKPLLVEQSGEASGPNGGWAYGDVVKVAVDLGESPSADDVMLEQLVALLTAQPDLTQVAAAARLATTRNTAAFSKAWPLAKERLRVSGARVSLKEDTRTPRTRRHDPDRGDR